jgi:structural maintenance of chromosome 4
MEKYQTQAKEAENVYKTQLKEHEVRWATVHTNQLKAKHIRRILTLRSAQKLGKEMEKAKSEWTAFERKDVKMTEDINHLRNKLKTLDKTIAQREKELGEKKASIKSSQEDIARLEAQHKKLTEELDKHRQKLETMYESLNDETKPLQEKLDAKQTQLMPFKKRLHEAEAKLDLAKSELELSEKRGKDAQAQYEQAVQDVEGLLEKISARVRTAGSSPYQACPRC